MNTYSYMVSIRISIAGKFGNQVIDSKLSTSVADGTTILDFIKSLKQRFAGAEISPQCIIDRDVLMMVNNEIIDELILSVIPVTLGNGIPLFTENVKQLKFTLNNEKSYGNGVVQLHYSILKNENQ